MGPRDPKEATILTQIDEERTEGTLEQKKLMSMFNGELNDLKLPEYQGLQSESKKSTFLNNTDKTAEQSGTFMNSADYDRQESEDLQALFKNLSIVNQKNAMTAESQEKVE